MNCIYQIKSKINNRVYIGKTNNFNRRVYEHERLLKKGTHYNPFLQRHFNKYGDIFKEVFDITIIENNLQEECIYEKEIYYINIYNAHNKKYGFNLTKGGEGNWTKENYIKRKKTVRLKYGVPVYCYLLNGEFVKKYNCISGCAEEMNFNRNAISNALNRGIRYKEYLFYREPKVFDNYIPNKSRKDLYINVFNIEGEQIDRVYGLKECAQKYNMNINTLNSRCRRLSVLNGIYFRKDYHTMIDQTMGK